MQSSKNNETNSQEISSNKESESPIFIHSLFRSGSTYLFNVFRRSPGSYWCYQEPIHEWPFSLKDNPKELLSSNMKENKLLRHPILEKPYFYELYETYDFWHETLVKEIIYDDYFGTYAPEKTVRYLLSLIEGAKGRPVIQECRTPSRVSEIQKRIGGIHIFLWRNPWDQWWSYKVTDYFDTVNQLIINAPSHPEVIFRLQKEIGFVKFSSVNISEEYNHYNKQRLTAENSYLVFFTLWVLGLIEGKTHANILLNIDSLSNSKNYREDILKQFSKNNINNIDLSDCRSPQSIYNEVDKRFFQKIEERVFGILMASGYSHSQIETINKLRLKHEPVLCEKSIQTTNLILLEEISKLRQLAKRIETREASTEQEYIAQLDNNRNENQLLMNNLTERDVDIDNLRGQVELLMHSLNKRDGDVTDLQNRVDRLINNIAELDRLVVMLQAQVDDLNNERDSVKERNDEIASLQANIQILIDNLANRDREISLLKSHNERLNNENSAAKVKIDDINNQIHQWWSVADGFNQELQAVYASKSWRLTRPLRLINKYNKTIFLGVKHLLKSVVELPRRFARFFLEAALAYVRRHPEHKNYIKGFVARCPKRMQSRLYNFVVARQVAAVSSPANAYADNVDLNSCTISVRIVYQQIVTARSRADQSWEKEGQA